MSSEQRKEYNPLFFGQALYANSPEWRAIVTATLLDASAQKQILTEIPAQIPAHAVPVGSVEFCAAIAAAQGITLPDPLDYPEALHPMLRRSVAQARVADVPIGSWCKSVATKAFPAQVLLPDRPILDDAGQPVAADMPCWISPVCHFTSEWRVYVMHGEIAGVAQYNEDGDDDDLSAEELAWVTEHLSTWSDAPRAYALDVGRLIDGAVALVEVNDAWGTGYYPNGTLTARHYANWLRVRWHSLPVLGN